MLPFIVGAIILYLSPSITTAIQLIVGGVAVFAAYLIFFQENVLYIPVIQGIRTPNQNPKGLRSPMELNMKYEDVNLVSGNAPNTVKIHGWFIPSPTDSDKAPTILFFHENAGNIGFRLPEYQLFQSLLGANIFCFDYRGYGLSEGSPSEEGLIEDGIAATNYLHSLAQSRRIHPDKIFFFGRSLGGAVVTHVATSNKLPFTPAGLILSNTFTSIEDLLDSIFPIFSFKFVKQHLLRLKWKSIEKISQINLPVLFLSGLKDEIVPASHMLRLKEACNKSKYSQFIEIPEGTHNDTWLIEKGGRKYWGALKLFLSKIGGDNSNVVEASAFFGSTKRRDEITKANIGDSDDDNGVDELVTGKMQK